MLKKRQLLAMISIAVMSFIVGTTFNVNFIAIGSDGTDDYGVPFDKIWDAVYDLQTRVTSLEESIKPKEWHFVISFTLSTVERVSPPFFIQGEKWRIKWEPHSLGWGGWFIWDENGYADITNYNILYKELHSICYVAHGEGSYYIELPYPGTTPTVDFTIESYH